MTQRWKQQIAKMLAVLGDSKGLGRRFSAGVASLDRILANDSSSSESNGERWLLDHLGGADPVVMFDVGAHRGEWSEMALVSSPRAQVYAFEPVPPTFQRLTAAVAGDDRIEPVQIALSGTSAPEELIMWTRGGSDTMSSAVSAQRDGVDEIRVPCTTGDRFMSERGLDHLDLLKIDVEGLEFEVLDGFAGALERRAVDVVQFEFTLWAVHARRWLGDYVDFFARYGYPVGRLMPRRVDWSPYRPADERFIRANHVAVRPGSAAARRLGAPDGVIGR